MAKRKFPRKMRKGPAAVIAALLIAAVGLLRSGCLEEPGSLPAGSQVQPVEGLLEVTFLDVGQGDSILLRTQEQNILIDAGEVEYGQTVVDDLADYGVEELDLVIATHIFFLLARGTSRPNGGYCQHMFPYHYLFHIRFLY